MSETSPSPKGVAPSRAAAPALLFLGLLLAGCGTTMSGRVVRPDGSPIKEPNIVVYTSPHTQRVKVDGGGNFKIRKNVDENEDYTLIAEDKDGNMGYVRSFKPKKGSNQGIVVRMSREVEGKDAVLEGGPNEGNGNGIGEKILKSSQ